MTRCLGLEAVWSSRALGAGQPQGLWWSWWLGLLLGLGACSPQSEDALRVQSLRSVQALLTNAQLQVVDVRTEEEWQAGHLPQSIWVPPEQWGQISSHVSKEQPVLLLCHSGGRAQKVARGLLKAGYTDVHVLLGAGVPDLLAQ